MIFDNILIYFVIVPVLTLGGLALCQNKGIKAIRTVAVTGASVLMALALYLVYYFLQQRGAGNNAEMLLTQSWTWYAPLNIKLALGVDGVSVAMILLSAFIVFAGVFASWKMDPLPRQFFMWFFLLSTGVFGFFISIDLFTMFMFYEVALIPMYLLIGVWGSGNKNYSAMKLTLMLMGGSAFLMLSILGIYFHSSTNPGALTMNLLEVAHNNAIPHNWQLFLFPMAFVGFGVLGAMFPFHTWSPDGHASAPTAVSMLHAGVLMKLGGYGCFRIAIFLMPYAAAQLGWIFLTLTGISIVYGAFSACVQTDLKYINAYSSVSHCGMVLFAILMFNQTAMTGAVLQMLSHGLMTALFFALIGMIYGRTHTRDIRDMGGMMHIMPYLGVGYIIAGLASLGLPGLSGFVAEMTIFFGSWLNSDIFRRVFTVIATTSIVITAVYILRVVGKLLFGPVQNEAHRKLTDATWFERLSTVTLMVAVAAIGCFPNFFVNIISNSFLPVVNALKDYFPVVMQ
ncbi:MAG: NADH-quinone oxidoreductase subunit M [Sodaliphilus pleomorphus]|jgi:NADH-quinone oxidoreductase subunit M|uniref:NADH-quinone oxidoreductase subunit M n=1 Tax=Sodaliphilus pleomorphus TaxID=2606626 RepID=A0A6L5XFD8_9BACT|nr:NADH-quinone oxidoreductase subunit M [Sodaliphilus pleomorphus]MCI5979936.1 NADH-quinone oxidoreductase subunit M [Muribaculaceae bacterium]MDY6252271.1 NADH-quinone oxidoreductase subunit M [Bacteroidales bacterium]MCI6169047.1 NADH-quinone oxidoreductase subunit M [Muribaculaceae bacterium]MDD6474453.1 NADH-quinone oxidoreductase subunit M [Sodaliphilus pleomorphus]MDD6686886.1 NADH-quinone oxidoreductase subunit M [Sodaliphilus pleomorphus]